LNRSYDVSRGQILLDGVDIREWELRTLRQAVGLVLQDVVLFSGTIEENLTLGRDAAHEEIHQALRMANAEGFVLGLPGGLREPVQERGANFSQGQRQLLSIARALIYDPAVLVLDEATSSVDPESEALIREAMEHLLERRTSLIIAHRLSTVHGADRILVLHKGQIREEGTHSALLVQGGLYARLYELQFGDEAVEPMGR
jgi:ATP-binding cassette subfamily B protein